MMGAKKAMHSTTNQEHSAMEQLAVQEAVSFSAMCALQYHGFLIAGRVVHRKNRKLMAAHEQSS